MSDPRADGANLIMHESAPFGRLYSYRSARPVGTMLAPGYFDEESGRLRAGDEIKLIRLAGAPGEERVADFAFCLVIASSRRDVILEPFVRRGQIRWTVATPQTNPSGEGWRARYGGRKRRYLVEDADGLVLAEGLDKAAAQAIAEGAEPLPKTVAPEVL